MKKKILSLGLIFCLIPSLLVGCGKKETVESIFSNCKENLKTIESQTINVDLDAAAQLASEGLTMDIILDLYLEAKYDKEMDMHLNGMLDFSFAGQEESLPIESYIDVEGQTVTGYDFDSDTNSWEKEIKEETVDEYYKGIEKIDLFGFLLNNKESFTLSEETITYREKECYELKGNINFKDLYAYFEELKLIDEEEENDILSSDMNFSVDANVPVVLYVHSEKMIPLYVEMDLFETLKAFESSMQNMADSSESFSQLDLSFNFKTFKITVNLKDQNKTEVEVPNDIKFD